MRDGLRHLYADYDMFLRPVMKFILAFASLFLIQQYLGFQEQLSSPAILAAASVICMFFPFGFISVIGACFVLANVYEVSLMMTFFMLILFLLIGVLYYGFRPGTGLILLLVPIAFILKLPFLVPIVLGLCSGIFSAIPAALGVIVWFSIRYAAQHFADSTSAKLSSDMLSEFMTISNGVFKDKYMLLILFSFVLCILIVHLISHLSIDHAWTISVVAGIIVLAFLMVLGGAYYGSESFAGDIISLVISFLLGLGYEMLFYCVDYHSTEHLQFEDDDYFYYVKAVPKIRPYDDDDRRE